MARRQISKYVQFTKMRWANIMERRKQRSEGKVSRDEFVYYAKTFAAEYQYLKEKDLLDDALNGSLSPIQYENFTKSTAEEASIRGKVTLLLWRE